MNHEWSSLGHEVYRFFQQNKLLEQKFLIGFSGGADSVFLVHYMKQFIPLENLKLLHCHHGDSEDEQGRYRNQAFSFCEIYAKKNGLVLLTAKAKSALTSEMDCREFRRAEFLRFSQDLNVDWICTGHHMDDLLETRLLKLIRGTSQAGFSAFSAMEKPFLRPLMKISKKDILTELSNIQEEFSEDPSNLNENYLRNWLRHHWLPSLEAKVPGAVNRLGISLDHLANAHLSPELDSDFYLRCGYEGQQSTLDLDLYFQLSLEEKKRLIALIFSSKVKQNYSTNSLQEVMKQLDKAKKGHSFVTGGLSWKIEDLGPGKNQVKIQPKGNQSS